MPCGRKDETEEWLTFICLPASSWKMRNHKLPRALTVEDLGKRNARSLKCVQHMINVLSKDRSTLGKKSRFRCFAITYYLFFCIFGRIFEKKYFNFENFLDSTSILKKFHIIIIQNKRSFYSYLSRNQRALQTPTPTITISIACRRGG